MCNRPTPRFACYPDLSGLNKQRAAMSPTANKPYRFDPWGLIIAIFKKPGPFG